MNFAADIEGRQKRQTHAHHHHLAQGIETGALVIIIEPRPGLFANTLNFPAQGVAFIHRQNFKAAEINLPDIGQGWHGHIHRARQKQRLPKQRLPYYRLRHRRDGSNDQVKLPLFEALE